MNCRSADFIGYSIFLEIFLEMLFLVAFGVLEKSVFTRLFELFATVMLANFQDRLVMTASITLRIWFILLFLVWFSGTGALRCRIVASSSFASRCSLRHAVSLRKNDTQSFCARSPVMTASWFIDHRSI